MAPSDSQPPDTDDTADLRERVAQLEQTVSKQSELLRRVMPSRRDFVKMGGGAAVGAAGVYAATGGAAGQTGPAGQQGTESEPNDMYAWDLDVQNGATFNGNPLSGVGAMDVEKRIVPDITTGTSEFFVEYSDTSGYSNSQIQQITEGVSTTTTVIYSSPHAGGGGLCLVQGRSSDVSGRFTELVMFHPFGSGPTVINSETRDTPDGRTYAIDGAELELSMAANTYNIIATSMDMQASG